MGSKHSDCKVVTEAFCAYVSAIGQASSKNKSGDGYKEQVLCSTSTSISSKTLDHLLHVTFVLDSWFLCFY